MIPPGGFEDEKYPLRHIVKYAFGLTMEDTQNSTYATLVKNYKTVNANSGVVVNPHNTDYVSDTGAICAPMSIIDKLKLSMTFSLTEQSTVTDGLDQIKFQWTPVFFSFPEKLDAADDDTSTTVAALLNLTKDATQEDVIPTWSGTNLNVTAPSVQDHPLSTVNLTEVATTHVGLTADAKMEAVAFNRNTFFEALRRYTNKGALKAVLGRTRNVTLSKNRNHASEFIHKFVPRAIRRIVPYSWFGILFHLPTHQAYEQFFYSGAPTADRSHIGVKIIATYHEWNFGYDQTRIP